jgi:hypothetical protein
VHVRALAPALWVFLVAGCASSGGGGGVRGRSPNVITTAELRSQVTQQEDAYAIIQRLRPGWLRPRQSSFSGQPVYPVVFLNGTRYGEIDSLHSFRVTEIASLELISATDATTRFGTGYTGGAIMVRLEGGGARQ